MSGKRKKTPLETFEILFLDAQQLLVFAGTLGNERTRRMREEKRARLGEALRIPQKQWPELDCVESDDLFLLLKPGTQLSRDQFRDHSIFLRQAIVAGCAALETYLADKVEERVRNIISDKRELPARLGKVELTIEDWNRIDLKYTRRRRGITEVVLKDSIRDLSSTSPNKLGQLLTLSGVVAGAPLKKVDAARRVSGGTTQQQLEEITDRRNEIAHSGDRVGRGRRPIGATEVKDYLSHIQSVVNAIESLFSKN